MYEIHQKNHSQLQLQIRVVIAYSVKIVSRMNRFMKWLHDYSSQAKQTGVIKMSAILSCQVVCPCHGKPRPLWFEFECMYVHRSTWSLELHEELLCLSLAFMAAKFCLVSIEIFQRPAAAPLWVRFLFGAVK